MTHQPSTADPVPAQIARKRDKIASSRNPLVRTDRILSEILATRASKDDFDGQPALPDVDTRDIDIVTHGYYQQMAERWQAVNDERAQLTHTQRRCRITTPHPHTAWDGLVLEKAYAALAESHPVRLRARLLDAATTVVAWIEDIDRRIATAAAAYEPPATHRRSDGVDCCPHTAPVAPGSCEHCWDLVKWDVLDGVQR